MIYRKEHMRSLALLIVSLMAFLPGCVHKGPILMDFMYQAPKTPVEETGRITAGVSPFRDARGKTDSVVGRRFNAADDVVNDLVVQGTAAEKVAGALKSALRARGVSVRSAPGWDLTEAGMPGDGTKLLISGEIKTLWVEVLSAFANTKVNAKVELRIVVADRDNKKIIRTLNVSSAIERQAVAYSTGLVQNTLSEALTTALNQLFNDDEVKKVL